MNGIYLDDGRFLKTTNQCLDPVDYAKDKNGDFWVVSKDTDTVYKYNSYLKYTGRSFCVREVTVLPSGISIDKRGRFHIACNSFDCIFIFGDHGVYLNEAYITSNETVFKGRIYATKNGKMAIECKTSRAFYLYDESGVYTNKYWKLSEFEENKIDILDRN